MGVPIYDNKNDDKKLFECLTLKSAQAGCS